MELQTIGQVSKAYNVSPRMLRYYEQVGLIKSLRSEDNAYRFYDAAALNRIQQIIFLRKLQIPVKQICVILENPKAVTVINIFKQNIAELEKEISALSAIKSILQNFVSEIERVTAVHLNLQMLNEDAMQKLVESLSLVQRNIKEQFNMNDLNRAAETLNKLHNVRVIYLPPMTVASVCFMEERPQEKAWEAMNEFIERSNLLKIKPDLRLFQFEHADANSNNRTGYEIWVSIPYDAVVAPPFVKKRFFGGQYAAHVMGNNGYETWLGLQDWINESDQYQYDAGLDRIDPPIEGKDGFGGTRLRLDLEEVLNFYNNQNPGAENQLDLLLSIKNYEISEETSAEIPDSIEKCGFKASIVTKNKFKIMGYTKIMTSEPDDINSFIEELKTDGRLDIINKYRKPGAPILRFGSCDMDTEMRGGHDSWRLTICLAESDITDVPAFMEHNLYSETIDASRWIIFEYAKGDSFDDRATCLKLGYSWNGVISGAFIAAPDGNISQPDPNDEMEMKSIGYWWYPVK